ncbi:SH3 domain-containing protein [Pelomonas sp. KK5]|uniref:SH3 domain-containing protein n=1 Tax=Pelomonas sp. KK5 TaxID=1855730 RepID=UPI00097BBFFF|nr:SH3 domain-containing protein [Pelomonas sp. KK5]
MKTVAWVIGLSLAAAAVQTACGATANATVLVLQDGAPLRAAARDSSPQQAQLARGEALEVRGERLDWLQVWDYRRERGGYLRRSQALAVAAEPAALLAQLRLTLPQDGAEGLGVALAAAYIQAATPAQLAEPQGAEVLDALGRLGERIAANNGPKRAALLDVATRYGLRFDSVEQADGGVRLCYDGDAFRRVLSLPAEASAKARAALALTRADCRASTLTTSQRLASDDWRAEVLEHAPLDGLAGYERNRLLLRRATVAASRAFARRDAALAGQALAEFARVQPVELPEDDLPEWNDAAMRVNAMRWLALPAPSERRIGSLTLKLEPGENPGEQCLTLAGTTARKCSLAAVMLASASLNREGTAIALAAQPLDGWRELWVLRRQGGQWQFDVLPPALAAPGLGYVEFAGWINGGLLVASESRAEGRYAPRRFAQLDLATLAPQRQSGEPMALGAFQRWADPAWRGASLALR